MRMYYCIIASVLVLFVLLLIIRKGDYDTREMYKTKETRCGGYIRPKVTARRPYKMVSSFTTSPTRIYKTDRTVYSLKEQTYELDYMLLNIPDKFARTGETYTIPTFIKVDKKIKVNKLDKDYGPATKLVGAILSIPKDEDVWIVVHDDDQMYLQETVNEYTKYIDGNERNPKLCYTISGFNFEGKQVIRTAGNLTKFKVCEGFISYCVHRSLFEDDFIDYINFALTNKEAFQSDDLILSNYIAKKGGKIYQIYNDNVNINMWWGERCELDYGLQSDALHKMAKKDDEYDPLGGHSKKYFRVIDWLKENNEYYMA